MADPTDYYFNEPVHIKHPQQEMYTSGLWADAISWWLQPNVSGTLTMYALTAEANRLPGINKITDWGKTGDSCTFKGVEWINTDESGAGIELFTPPWATSPNSFWLYEYPEIVPYERNPNAAGNGINGSWEQKPGWLADGTPTLINDGHTGLPYRYSGSMSNINTYSKLTDLYQLALARRLPLDASVPIHIVGSGCQSKEDLGTGYIVACRFKIDGPPYNEAVDVRFGSPDELFRVGWVSFGHQ